MTLPRYDYRHHRGERTRRTPNGSTYVIIRVGGNYESTTCDYCTSSAITIDKSAGKQFADSRIAGRSADLLLRSFIVGASLAFLQRLLWQDWLLIQRYLLSMTDTLLIAWCLVDEICGIVIYEVLQLLGLSFSINAIKLYYNSL